MLATTGIPIFFLLFAEYNEHVLKRVVRITTTSIHHLVRVISLRFPVLRTMQAWVVVDAPIRGIILIIRG